jgi:hypothetical protein
MHWRHQNASQNALEVIKAVRICQNSLGQDNTHLGLFLLHLGPNGDRLGGQAYMEHYTGLLYQKDSKICLIQDYQALNVIMQKNQCPLPLIDDLIHPLKDAHYFTKLNVCWGHDNVHIREGDK